MDRSPATLSLKVLVIEPFYGGSHKILIDILLAGLSKMFDTDKEVCLVTMSAKKWHWRARTSALHFADSIPRDHNFRVVFASSVLNLAELLGLRPDLAGVKKIVYFHENQLVYPVRQYKDRDFQYGYNQTLTCLVADVVLFNSEFNMKSFLECVKKFFAVQPDYRPKNLRERIEAKSRVLYFPVSPPTSLPPSRDYSESLHIVWPHRWEHDKDPGTFVEAMRRLSEVNTDFRVSMVGQQFTEVPQEVDQFKNNKSLQKTLVHWGYLPVEQYYALLSRAHIVVSTAKHEFFGVAMLEATMLGCYPLCPERLVYPEIYPSECLYTDIAQLVGRLEAFLKDRQRLKEAVADLKIDFRKFSLDSLLPLYLELFE